MISFAFYHMLFSILAGTNAYMLLEHLTEIPLVIISDISGYFRDFEAAFPQHLFACRMRSKVTYSRIVCPVDLEYKLLT